MTRHGSENEFITQPRYLEGFRTQRQFNFMQPGESINLGVSIRPEDDLCGCVSPTMRKTGCCQCQEAPASFLLVFK